MMKILATDQELDDWVLLLELSGITTMSYAPTGAMHVTIDQGRKRKAMATLDLLAKRLGPMALPARYIFMSTIASLDARRMEKLAEEHQAYRIDLFIALDHEDDTPAHSLRALAPSLH